MVVGSRASELLTPREPAIRLEEDTAQEAATHLKGDTAQEAATHRAALVTAAVAAIHRRAIRRLPVSATMVIMESRFSLKSISLTSQSTVIITMASMATVDMDIVLLTKMVRICHRFLSTQCT